MKLRADSAGCTAGLLAGCRERNVGFYVTARRNAQVVAAIDDAEGLPGVWGPTGDHGAAVAELTPLIDTSALPTGTRLIVRREPLHPGAQGSLFPSMEFRDWGFYTDDGGDPAELDATMRAHAHVEQHIQRLKGSGLCRFPFTDATSNAAWMTAVAFAADLVRRFQLLCLPDVWQNARPKTLRWKLFHAPGRYVRSARRHVVRILEHWPTADVLPGAYRRIELIT